MERRDGHWHTQFDGSADGSDRTTATTRDGSRVRLAAYRLAQARLRDELRAGKPRTIAVWAAGRAAGERYDLAPATWALLVHALLIASAE
jgi:hypothetical protein